MISIKSPNTVSLTIILLLFPLQSHAASWEYVGSSGSKTRGDYTEIFIDTENIKRISSNKYSYWEKIDYSKNKTEKANYELQKWDIDCDNSVARIRASVKYNSSGGVLESVSWSEYQSEWTSLVPESIGEALGEKVCS